MKVHDQIVGLTVEMLLGLLFASRAASRELDTDINQLSSKFGDGHGGQ